MPKKISKKTAPPRSLLSDDDSDEDLLGILNIKPSPILKVPTPKQSPQTVKPLSPEIKKKKRRDSTRRTPIASFEELSQNKDIDLATKLSNYRYSTFEFLDSENDKFVACIDPLGSAVIIYLDSDGISVIDDVILKSLKRIENTNFNKNEIEFLKTKVSNDVTGSMIYYNNEYVFLIYDDSGNILESYFTSSGIETNVEDELLKIYPIIKLSEIFEDAHKSIERTRNAYNLIRRIDNSTNYNILKGAEDTILNIQRIYKTFINSYNKFSKSLTNDIGVLEDHAREWYKLYGEQKLTKEDNESFRNVNINLFERYKRLDEINKTFRILNLLMNNQILINNKLYDISKDIEKAYDYLSDNVLQESEVSLTL